jgi:hypothetical protein
MTANKTVPNELSVAVFIGGLADESRRADAEVLMKLIKDATGEDPRMWGTSIIGFGTYHYRYESGREGDMMVVGFSPRKASIVLYGLRGASDSESLLGQLGKFKTEKGCLYIKRLSDVNQKVLKDLLVKAYAAARERHSS